jgi:hypothetical protein
MAEQALRGSASGSPLVVLPIPTMQFDALIYFVER